MTSNLVGRDTATKETLTLRVTDRQLRELRSTIEMEIDRTTESQGCCGAIEDEIENLRRRIDLLDTLAQFPR